MKMKKRIIIIMSSLAAFVIAGIAVYAAFSFKRVVDGSAETGTATVESKSFIDYQSKTTGNESMRIDTVARLDDIVLESSETYSQTTDTIFQKSKTYYVLGKYTKATVTIGEDIPGNTYYEDSNGGFVYATGKFTNGRSYYTKESESSYTQVNSISRGANVSDYSFTYYEKIVTYSGIKSIGTKMDGTKAEIAASLDATKKIITLTKDAKELAKVTCTIDASKGITKASVSFVDSESETNTEAYQAILDTDALGMVIIDTRISKTATRIESTVENPTIICSATENKQNDENIYLNQLGMEFTFTNTIDVYVRIHIQDAWIQTKQYSTNEKQTYSIKDQISGSSPFAISDSDWTYVPSENTAYLKQKVSYKQNADGSFASHTFSFDVNPAYYYVPSTKTTVYREYVDVEVTFKVDIVQANRAKALWGFDPSELS